MANQIQAGDQVLIIPGLDNRVMGERGSVGLVTRAWRDPSGIEKIDVAFPGTPVPPIMGDYASRYIVA